VKVPPHRGEALTMDKDALHGLRVLLVEDHKVNQIIGRQMLVRAGSDVVMAENGEQGVRAWEEQGPFDIILMDYHVRKKMCELFD
jgi:CheY-like chemotaxis protein